MTSRLAVVVLAAGKGTRMRSELPKVLHAVANRPMVAHVLAAVEPLSPEAAVVVLAPEMDGVATLVAPARVAIQPAQRGTGDAVRAALPALGDLMDTDAIDDVLVVYGDTPLLACATLERLVGERRRDGGCAVAVLGMHPENPGAYGRLVTGAHGTLEAIIEAKDATDEQRRIGLCNSGVMAVASGLLPGLLESLNAENAQGEFYLTDIVSIARERGLGCRAVEGPTEELAGVNSRAELAVAEAAMQPRLRRNAVEAGATLIAPETVFLSADTLLGRDARVHPYVVFGPGVTVGEGAEIQPFCHLAGASVGAGATVGPFARLRPGAELSEQAHVGNFVEVKASRVGRGAKANHLSYIGDSDIGAGVNIGAGTITCNYDGFLKHLTVVGDGAFIGSNTALVAPVRVGEGAIVGAGSVITRDVAPDAIATARGEQTERPGAAAPFRARRREDRDRRRKASSTGGDAG